MVFSDALNHASIIDGCRLARAETFVYDHCDTDHLEWGLRQAGGRGALIVTDGVFSMDGDIAPLEEIVELAQRYDARVMVDEAHGTGAVGPGGRGAVAGGRARGRGGHGRGHARQVARLLRRLRVLRRAPIAKYLVNTARTLIFSTALPPPAVAAAMAALELLREQPRRVEKLQRNADVLREALARAGARRGARETQIVPLVVGDAAAAVDACERALERGVFAQAIRPPTVPDGTSRLRLAVMASHTRSELREAARRARARRSAPALEARRRATGASAPPRVFDALRDAA